MREKNREYNRNGTYRLCCLLSLMLCVLPLTGCQLAREEAATSRHEDRLCGVLITTQEQTDAYWQSHRGETADRTEAIVQMELGNELPGWPEGYCIEAQPDRDGEYNFPELEGAPMMMILKQQDEAGDYWRFTSDGAMQDIHCNSSATDRGESNHIEGTVYLEQGQQVILYANQVYQRPDGSVYVLLNSSKGFQNIGENSLGEVFSQSFKEEFTREMAGKKEFMGTELTVHVAVGEETLGTVIKEWGSEDTLLRETPVARGQEEFYLLEETAYVTIEEEKKGGGLKRSIYTWDAKEAENKDLSHPISYGNTSGLLETEYVTFLKP